MMHVATQGAASPANLSPIHSPATGTPIAPTTQLKSAKDHVNDLQNALRHQHAMQQAAAAAAVSLPSSMNFRFNHPLASMARLPMPSIPMTPTHLANSLAAAHQQAGSQSAPGGHHKSRKQLHMNGLSAHRQNSENTLLDSPRSEQKHRVPKRERDPDHIKKPLNAFMIFMKENRQKLMEEKGYKERQSAELNKELGRLWHTLTHEEQQKYYQIARDERQKHMQRYPGWSARDNYAVHKKKKRKRDKSNDNLEMKKCRARFGLERQAEWCKHCRRKKRCLWFREGPTQPGSNKTATSEEQSPPAQVSSTTQGSPDALGSAMSNDDHPNVFGLNKEQMLNMNMLYNPTMSGLFNHLPHMHQHSTYSLLNNNNNNSSPSAPLSSNPLNRPPVVGSADSGSHHSGGSSIKLEHQSTPISDTASSSASSTHHLPSAVYPSSTTNPSATHSGQSLVNHSAATPTRLSSRPPATGRMADDSDGETDDCESDDDLLGEDLIMDSDGEDRNNGVQDLSMKHHVRNNTGEVASGGQRTPPPTRTAFDLATVVGV